MILIKWRKYHLLFYVANNNNSNKIIHLVTIKISFITFRLCRPMLILFNKSYFVILNVVFRKYVENHILDDH